VTIVTSGCKLYTIGLVLYFWYLVRYYMNCT